MRVKKQQPLPNIIVRKQPSSLFNTGSSLSNKIANHRYVSPSSSSFSSSKKNHTNVLLSSNCTPKKKRITWKLVSSKKKQEIEKNQSSVLSSIDHLSYEQIKTLLIQQKLIKPTSNAPESILRQIARGVLFL